MEVLLDLKISHFSGIYMYFGKVLISQKKKVCAGRHDGMV